MREDEGEDMLLIMSPGAWLFLNIGSDSVVTWFDSNIVAGSGSTRDT